MKKEIEKILEDNNWELRVHCLVSPFSEVKPPKYSIWSHAREKYDAASQRNIMSQPQYYNKRVCYCDTLDECIDYCVNFEPKTEVDWHTVTGVVKSVDIIEWTERSDIYATQYEITFMGGETASTKSHVEPGDYVRIDNRTYLAEKLDG